MINYKRALMREESLCVIAQVGHLVRVLAGKHGEDFQGVSVASAR
jgi:hypothetical protein